MKKLGRGERRPHFFSPLFSRPFRRLHISDIYIYVRKTDFQRKILNQKYVLKYKVRLSLIMEEDIRWKEINYGGGATKGDIPGKR